jgi:hypothetical protein
MTPNADVQYHSVERAGPVPQSVATPCADHWAAFGICPLAADRRCPPAAVSSRSALAVDETTAIPVLSSQALQGRASLPGPDRSRFR